MNTTSDFIKAGVTGSPTTAALLEDGPMDALGFRTSMILWCSGNIDAPELIVAGGCKAIVIEGTFEATTPRTIAR